MTKMNTKIIKQYIISIICIALYIFLENSTLIPYLVEISNKGRYGSFPTFFLAGLFKYGLLVFGVLTIIFLSYRLYNQKISKNK